MTEFTPWLSLLGGGFIGLAAVLLMGFHGRVAGMTGIVAGLLPTSSSDPGWRAAFLCGAIAAPALLVLSGYEVPFDSPTSPLWLVIGGLVVGVGVTYGSGCTSGHGVCGVARLSPRSMVATLVFMIAAGTTVFIVRHLTGGL